MSERQTVNHIRSDIGYSNLWVGGICDRSTIEECRRCTHQRKINSKTKLSVDALDEENAIVAPTTAVRAVAPPKGTIT